jgi:hypothetical protein
MPKPDIASRELPLDELISRARAASVWDVGDWCALIVPHGIAAIDAMSPWLMDPWFGASAAIVITQVGGQGFASRALRALRLALPSVPKSVEPAVLKGIDTLALTGVQLVPAYDEPHLVHHVVVEHATDDDAAPKELYLTACRWAYSGEYAASLGGVVPMSGQPICSGCRDALLKGHQGLPYTPSEANERTFVRRATAWHIVEGDLWRAPDLGSFYLFKCYRWAEVTSEISMMRGQLIGAEGPCKRCGELDSNPQHDPATTVPAFDEGPD